ncbi:DUF2656 family protein [Synechococcus sp. PCC 7336]|uniref:DUF2656 family protein n=1 Tax=Synechococcus sp. PCC 7336 TaxID=195250 RepID=UPI00036209A7|nr:DUF2656 family protein [Synechococcus sp. PCC 7336]
MSESLTARMLLSHNHNVSEEIVPALSPAEFAAIFSDRLNGRPSLSTQAIEHPHWIVEIRFDNRSVSPAEVGELCARALCRTQALAVASRPIATASPCLHAANDPKRRLFLHPC